MNKKYQKYLAEFGGARMLAAVGMRTVMLFAPLCLLAVIGFAVYEHTSHAQFGTYASLGTLAFGGLVAGDGTAELTKKLDGLEGEIKTFIAKAESEIKNTGSASIETKTAVEKLATEAKGIMDRLLAVEQKMTAPRGEERLVKTAGDLFIESDNFKSLVAGSPRSGKVNIGSFQKTALVNITGQNQPLVAPHRIPGIVTPAMQPLMVRDLFPVLPTSSNLVEYVHESSYTSAAALQGVGSSPQVYENVAKAESAMAFELLYQPVQTIAHWIPVSKQLLADAPALSGYINTRLLYGLKLKEETELLAGTGTGASIKGLVTCATAYETTRAVTGDTYIDQLSHAGAQVKASFYPWQFTILNPADVEKINLLKTTGTASSGQYIVADPRSNLVSTIWGRPIVECPALTAGKFLVGSSMAATIWDRQNASVEVSLEHSDYFVKNMAAILAEERLALTVEVPLALVYGSFV